MNLISRVPAIREPLSASDGREDQHAYEGETRQHEHEGEGDDCQRGLHGGNPTPLLAVSEFPSINRIGQEFYDQPVVVQPRVSTIERSVMVAFKRQPPSPIRVGTERVRLKWLP